MKNRRLPLAGTIVTVVAVVIALAVISNRSSTAERATLGVANAESSSTSPVTPSEDPLPEVPTGPSTTESLSGPYTTPNMPVEAVATAPTTGLRSGDVVTAVATPSNGSQAFAVEARLCRGDASIRFDAEMFPSRSGLCLAKPFVDGTDSFLEIPNQPPYGPITVRFKVGTGSQSFTLQDSSQATISCDASSPCQLVLKIHYPNGFGFHGIPLSFS